MSGLDKLLSGSERLALEGVIVGQDRTKTRGLPFIWGPRPHRGVRAWSEKPGTKAGRVHCMQV